MLYFALRAENGVFATRNRILRPRRKSKTLSAEVQIPFFVVVHNACLENNSIRMNNIITFVMRVCILFSQPNEMF